MNWSNSVSAFLPPVCKRGPLFLRRRVSKHCRQVIEIAFCFPNAILSASSSLKMASSMVSRASSPSRPIRPVVVAQFGGAFVIADVEISIKRGLDHLAANGVLPRPLLRRTHVNVIGIFADHGQSSVYGVLMELIVLTIS